jgi:hypothetical protein
MEGQAMSEIATAMSGHTAAGDPAAASGALYRLRQVMQAHPRQWLSRLGTPGIVAIGLFIACAGFYASVLMPLDSGIDEIRDRVNLLTSEVERATKGSRQGVQSISEQMAEFYGLFPRQGQLTDTVAKVFHAASSQGIALQHGEYRVAEDRPGELRRFQMVLPVKAEYPRIRRFLASVAAEVPTAALEHIQFERQKIADPQVEATIKLAVYLEQGS